MRPVGAFLFGMMADRFGRRPTLMIDIIAYSVFELASAFAPSLKFFLIMRALFGIAMGGEWGVGAALAFETLPAEGRGFFSGLLQEGYVVGYLFAALVYGTLFPFIGWRGMFVIGALPAFLVIYIRTKVEESPAWLQGRVSRQAETHLAKDIVAHLGSFLFLVVLMSEICPTRIRGRAMSIATVCLWCGTLIVTLTFLSLVRVLTAPGAFLLYALICVAAVVFVWRGVPETKGRSLEDIESWWRIKTG